MASQFLGLPVVCRLRDGSSVEGTVISIDAIQGVLTLEPATVRALNGQSYTTGSQTLSRTEVAGLELLSVTKSASAPNSDKARSTGAGSAPSTPGRSQHSGNPPPPPVPEAQQPLSQQFAPSSVPRPINNNNSAPFLAAPTENSAPFGNGSGSGGKVPSAREDDTEEEGEPRAARRQQKSGRGKNKSSAKAKANEFGRDAGNEADQSTAPYDDEVRSSGNVGSSGYTPHNAPINSFNQDFDFLGSLSRFDKAKEFDKIRSQDETDPSLRLVAHNRKQKHLVKLAPTENVLSPSELLEQQQKFTAHLAAALKEREATTDTSADEASASEYEKEPRPVAVATRRGTLKPNPNLNPTSGSTVTSTSTVVTGGVASTSISTTASGLGGGGFKGFVTSSGVKVEEIKLRQYKEALSIADIETGPNATQRSENGGRGIASFILQTLSRDRRLFPLDARKRPHICIIVDDCDKGATALRAGVHLANHGAKVVSLILTTQDHSELFRTNLRVFSAAGGRILREIEDLPSGFDLLIDAIADNEVQASIEPKSAAQVAAASWASSSGVPILSIDAPLGVDHDTGAATITSPIRPRFIACCGALRSGCRTSAAEVVLLDMGFAPALWSRVGLDDWEPTMFGFDFVLPLRRG